MHRQAALGNLLQFFLLASIAIAAMLPLSLTHARTAQDQKGTSLKEGPAGRRLRATLLAKRRGIKQSSPNPTPPNPTLFVPNSPPENLADQAIENKPKFENPIPESAESLSSVQPLEYELETTIEQSIEPVPYTLPALIDLAAANHPTLGAAAARVDAARNEALQAGLGPNPQLGLFMDEVGNDDDPGLIGIYIQRKVIRGNKLGLSRRVKSREAIVLQNELQTQAVRVETDVRTAFYKVLIAQQKLELSRQLAQSQRDSVTQAERLFESGETPKTDLLQTKLQAQKTLILVTQSEVELQNSWRELAVVTGNPSLPFAPVDGSLNSVAQPVTFEECQQHIFSLSPELKSALAEVDRVQATISRELAQQIPDYQTQVRVGKDSTTEHFFAGVQLQIPIMVCNRNQGNIAAARSRLVEAHRNVETIKLQLSQRLAKQYKKYQAALVTTNMYNSKLIPQAQENLELLTQGYPEEVEVLQILSAQKQIVDFTFEYLDSLNNLWMSRSSIEGLLLEKSLSN